MASPVMSFASCGTYLRRLTSKRPQKRSAGLGITASPMGVVVGGPSIKKMLGNAYVVGDAEHLGKSHIVALQ
jgi:hypothetical protein